MTNEDDPGTRNEDDAPPDADSGRTGGLTLNLNLSLGRKPPLNDPRVRELLEEAQRKAAESPDGTGTAESTRAFSLEFKDGALRFGGDAPPYERPKQAEQPPAPTLTFPGEFADTARVRRLLNRIVLVLAASIPIALLIAAWATGQTFETGFYMVFFGLIIAFMLGGAAAR